LESLLEYFWKAHDASQVDGQGADIGTQYRSIVLYADATQKAAVEASKTAAQKDYVDPIVTEIVPLVKFWPAEDYHQDYFAKNPGQGYCQAVIRPKVSKLKKLLEKKH
jgi:peptide-methionine (S)-S-oxide reductase